MILKQKKTLTNTFDAIFVGTSIINILEAIYQTKLGKNVLMIDIQNDIGGAWKSLDIFGLKNVENAIHYFLNDRDGLIFMKKKLKWNIIETKGKFKIFHLGYNFYFKLPYNKVYTFYIQKILDLVYFKTISFKEFLFFFKNRKKLIDTKSFYVSGGSIEMLKKIKLLLKNSNVKTQFNCKVDEILVNTKNKNVSLKTSCGIFFTKKFFISHGSRLSKLKINRKALNLKEKFHPRPAVHLLVKDSKKPEMLEGILIEDNLIKYVHDITRFTTFNKKNSSNEKVYVFGLKHDIKNDNSIKNLLLQKIKTMGLVGKNCKILNYKWTDIILPTLYDQDLIEIKNKSEGLIEIMFTENFCKGIGLYAKKWSTLLE